jgi:hypothetical protein
LSLYKGYVPAIAVKRGFFDALSALKKIMMRGMQCFGELVRLLLWRGGGERYQKKPIGLNGLLLEIMKLFAY